MSPLWPKRAKKNNTENPEAEPSEKTSDDVPASAPPAATVPPQTTAGIGERALDVGGDLGLGISGDHVSVQGVTINMGASGLSERVVSFPVVVGTMPAAARRYQARSQSGLLRTALEDGGTVVLTGTSVQDTDNHDDTSQDEGGSGDARWVLSGLGGVGKTQIAAHHARTQLADGQADVVVWATATDRSSVLSAYAQAARTLGLPGFGEDDEQNVALFLAWLQPRPVMAGTRAVRWLIMLDNITDPNQLTGLWPPTSPLGQTLATTRRRDAALRDRGTRIDVDVFTPAEALAFLTRRLTDYGHTEPEHDLRALAHALGYLPLALAQAAAYLADTGHSAADYHRMLTERTARLAELTPDALPDDQELPVAAVWDLSIQYADALPPVGLARPLLALLSVLSPDGIPTALIATETARIYLGRNATDVNPASEAAEDRKQVEGRQVTQALSVLHRLSLIDRTADAIRVHALVQHTTRDTLTTEQHTTTTLAAANALLEAWPERPDHEALPTLIANASALHAAGPPRNKNDGLHVILFIAGQILGRTGQITAAHTYFEHLHKTAHRLLGPDHPHTLATRNSLARWRGEAGDTQGAVTAFAELLDDRTRILGPDHPDTLITRGNLAYWRGEAGDTQGAVNATTELLDDHLRILGPDHPQTLAIQGNLAYWRGEAGDTQGAADAFAELLDDRTRILGPDHPDTLATRNSLARWRGEAGDTQGAVTAFAELLDDRTRILGPDHPDTLITRNNLTSWRGEAGDTQGAVTAFAELLDDRTRILGPDHPDTLATRNNLTSWRGEAGDTQGAADAFAELLDDRTRILGPDHPDTLITRNNLASWRGRAGDTQGAVTAFAELLDDRTRILGPDHPDTLATRNNLASWRGRAGDTQGAADAIAELLNDRTRILGPDHPDTLATRNNLIYWRGRAGDTQGAADAIAELLNDQLRILGPDHPQTLTTRNNLASWRGETGDTQGAADAFVELLNDQLRILGPDHPDTLATRGNLASWRGEAGDTQGAVNATTELLNDHLRILGPDHPDTLATRGNLASWRGRAGDSQGAADAFAELLNDHLRILGPDHPQTLAIQGSLAYWLEEADRLNRS
ncbi:tetratricopeptide repeat protein [Streptomyces sp. bgisy093]|uniref:tetratricopeptide repeat protein n=2 Tax=Streptomyces TaxID=1883 RepID=UPI003EB74019